MRVVTALLIILCTLLLAAGQTQKGSANASLESELRTLTRDMHDALIRGDKEHLFDYFAQDFIGTSYDGFTVTKDDLIRHFRPAPSEAKITRDIEDFKARGTGDSAVVSYRVVEHVEIGEDKHSEEFLYTDTFVKRGGRWQVLASQATRIEPERKIAKVDPSIYDSYVGHYSVTPNLIFTVSREADRLIGEAPDGSKVELLPENETTFFIRGRNVLTRFIRDESGKVTHMIIGTSNNGTKIKKID